MTITDQMVEAALQAYCGQDHQLDFGVLADYLKAMRAAIEAAEAAASPDPRDATIAALRAEVERLRDALRQIIRHELAPDGSVYAIYANSRISAWNACGRVVAGIARAALGDAP